MLQLLQQLPCQSLRHLHDQAASCKLLEAGQDQAVLKQDEEEMQVIWLSVRILHLRVSYLSLWFSYLSIYLSADMSVWVGWWVGDGMGDCGCPSHAVQSCLV